MSTSPVVKSVRLSTSGRLVINSLDKIIPPSSREHNLQNDCCWGCYILSAVIASAIAKLTSVDMRSLFSRTRVENELRKWKPRLLEIHAVLSDAEDKQVTSPAVKRWLRNLLDLAYDVEDVLDEFETEALGRELRRDSQASMSFTQKLLPACCIGLKPGALMQNMKMVSQLDEITTRLQEIVREKNDLDLGTSAGRRSNIVNSRATTSLLKEPHVYGRENDKHAIIQMMTGEASDSRFYVIRIIGIGEVLVKQLSLNLSTMMRR